MTDSFQPLPQNAQEVADLIFSLKEGEGIWFSFDNNTGHNGAHDWISKAVEGDEYVYKCEGDHCNNSYLESDEDVSRIAQEIVNDGSIRFYTIQSIPDYIKHTPDPEHDDQALGSYELNGPDEPEPQFEGKQNFMKKELLEYLVRQCTREVLLQINENNLDEGDPAIKGAAAPPADGMGTGDQSAIPNQEPEIPEEPEDPETPPSSEIKGVVFVNPKNKAKLQKIQIGAKDDAGIERELYNQASKMTGSRTKIALSTMRAVKDAVRNPNTSVYLYLGKYDPNSEEIFLMADKSLQVAKDASVSASEATGTPLYGISPGHFDPTSASSEDYQNYMSAAGKTPVHGLSEEHKNLVKQIVSQILDKR
jgi:hypothetical protein